MNTLKFLTLLAIFFFYFSCGGDDSCGTDAWIGTWTGTLNCDDNRNNPLTLRITMVDENTILLDSGSGTFEVDINGCNININETQSTNLGDLKVDIQASVEGNTMIYDVASELLGITISCMTTLTK